MIRPSALFGIVGVGVVDEHHDRLRRVEGDPREIVQIERAARADDDFHPVLVDDLVAQLALHLDLVALGHDHDDDLLARRRPPRSDR